jgi:hypothetical protein
VVLVGVHDQRQALLAEIVLADNQLRTSPRLCQNREQESDQEGNDGNDDKQLYECKRPIRCVMPSHDSLHARSHR